MFNSIKTRFKDWKHARYLKKMGWSQRQYDLNTDPDYRAHASRVKDIYLGYSYIAEFTSDKKFSNDNTTWWDGVYAMNKWCSEHITHKWRSDIIRVNKQHGIGEDDVVTTEWWSSGFNGDRDVLFVAFKNEQDFMWFNLKWR